MLKPLLQNNGDAPLPLSILLPDSESIPLLLFFRSINQSLTHTQSLTHSHNHSPIHTITRSFTQSQVLNHSLAFLSSSLITVHVVSPENTIRKHKKRAKQKEQRTKKKYIGVLTR